MTHSSDKPLEEPNPKVESALTNIKKTKAYLQDIVMDKENGVWENVPPWSLMDYTTPSLDGKVSSIGRPAIIAAQFEILLATITMIQQMVQFYGLAHENPSLNLQLSGKYVTLLSVM